MDNKVFVKALTKKLNKIFCDANIVEKKYAEAWLTKEDFGGLYPQGNKYVLNVKAEHEIPSCSDEISNVTDILFEKLSSDERSYIWAVAVYNATDEIHCANSIDEIPVFDEAKACQNDRLILLQIANSIPKVSSETEVIEFLESLKNAGFKSQMQLFEPKQNE